MTSSNRKVKLSITLSPDLLAEIDREVNRGVLPNRSALIEAWLRNARRADGARRLDARIAAYYDDLAEAEEEEDADWAAFASEAFTRIDNGQG